MAVVTGEIIMICDKAYEEMMEVCFASIDAHGGVPDTVRMVVYDTGMSVDARLWCEQCGVVVRSLAAAPRVRVPSNRLAEQATLDRSVCYSWAALHSAATVGDGGVVFSIGADMVCVKPFWADLVKLLEANPNKVLAVPEMETVGKSNMYLRTPQPEGGAALFQSMFAQDLCGIQAWNNVFAANGATVKTLYRFWQHVYEEWANEPKISDLLVGKTIDQFAFSYSIAANEGIAAALPVEFNMTRVHWTCQPQLISRTRILHLTGPIKPWQPAGRVHPMTLTWLGVAQDLQENWEKRRNV